MLGRFRFLSSSRPLHVAVFAAAGGYMFSALLSAAVAGAVTLGPHVGRAPMLHPAVTQLTKKLLTFTFTGLLLAGFNGGGQVKIGGPFGPRGSLVGKHYTLKITVDPGSGLSSSPHNPACPPNVFLQSEVVNNSGTAELYVDGYPFGFAGSSSAALTGSSFVPCSTTAAAKMYVNTNGQTGVSVQLYADKGWALGFPVNIWSNVSWPAPVCKYTVDPSILYYDASINMQFNLTVYDQNGNVISAASGGDYSGDPTHENLTVTVTNSLFPCAK